MLPRGFILPNGNAVSVRCYLQSWRILKGMPATDKIRGWEWYPVPAAEILADIRRGIHDRINQRGGLVILGVWGPHPWRTVNGEPEMGIQTINIERAGENCYRAPTDEERTAFAASQKQKRAEAKATKPKALAIINPTPEDAAKLQAIINKTGRRLDREECDIRQTTQAAYSANSKGDYAPCETRTVYVDGRVSRKSTNLWSSEGKRYDDSLRFPVCKVRMFHGHVVVLTDKPQKPLPLDWGAIANGTAIQAAEAAQVTDEAPEVETALEESTV